MGSIISSLSKYEYKVTIMYSKNLPLTTFWLGSWMFHQPAWTVGNYSSGPLGAGTLGTKLTGGFYRPELLPCMVYGELAKLVLET